MAKKKAAVKKIVMKKMPEEKRLMFGFSFKNFSNCDAFCFKTGVAAFMLFLVSVLPSFGRWVRDTHWGWFLAIFVLCWIKVMRAGWKK